RGDHWRTANIVGVSRAGQASRPGRLSARHCRVAVWRRLARVPGCRRRIGSIFAGPREGPRGWLRTRTTHGPARPICRCPALNQAPPSGRAMLTFAYPWLIALLPAPLLVRWLAPPYRESTTGLRVPFLDRVARLTGQTPSDGAVVRRRHWLSWA